MGRAWSQGDKCDGNRQQGEGCHWGLGSVGRGSVKTKPRGEKKKQALKLVTTNRLSRGDPVNAPVV